LKKFHTLGSEWGLGSVTAMICLFLYSVFSSDWENEEEWKMKEMMALTFTFYNFNFQSNVVDGKRRRLLSSFFIASMFCLFHEISVLFPFFIKWNFSFTLVWDWNVLFLQNKNVLFFCARLIEMFYYMIFFYYTPMFYYMMIWNHNKISFNIDFFFICFGIN
jgi:hypothetical protein